jgi:hypothetical protein
VKSGLHEYEHCPALAPVVGHPVMETVPFESEVGLQADKSVHGEQGALPVELYVPDPHGVGLHTLAAPEPVNVKS